MLLKKVYNFIHHNSELSKYVVHSSCFTRNRALSFSSVVLTILHLFKESVTYNISTVLPFLNIRPVTAAAFSLARFKIKIDFFKDLNKILSDFHLANQPPSTLWKGFRLIAGDGSTVSLPASRQMKTHFGVHSQNDNGVKNCLAQVFMLYDVTTDFIISGRLSTMEHSERKLFIESLEDMAETKAIFLLDRGFGHFNTCKRLSEQGRDFCIRLSVGASLFARAAMENPMEDFITFWEPSHKEKITCKKHGFNYAPIRVRVTKIIGNNKEVILLVSSLVDSRLYSLTDMKQLFKLRWGIEEGYKKLKPKMKLEQFGTRKPDGILQEFEAHIFMMNIVSLIGNLAQQEIEDKYVSTKHKYKYNWQNAYRFIRGKIVQLINKDNIKSLLNQLIDWIANSITAVRKHRSFPRSPLRKNKTRLHQTYK